MSLSHDSYDFLAQPHGVVTPTADPELRLHVGSFFGVKGESHITGEVGGQDLICEIFLEGYATLPLLQTDVDALNARKGTLTGTLTETIDGNDRTFPQCTFLGFQPAGPPFRDGVTNNWVQFGTLLWRWRKPV